MTKSSVEVTLDWVKSRKYKTKIKLTDYKDGKALKPIYVKG